MTLYKFDFGYDFDLKRSCHYVAGIRDVLKKFSTSNGSAKFSLLNASPSTMAHGSNNNAVHYCFVYTREGKHWLLGVGHETEHGRRRPRRG